MTHTYAKQTITHLMKFRVFFVYHFNSEALVKLLASQKMELISMLRLCMDFTQAVSTLPRGWLWGGRLQTWHVGALGSLFAFLGIYQYFAKKKLKK